LKEGVYTDMMGALLFVFVIVLQKLWAKRITIGAEEGSGPVG